MEDLLLFGEVPFSAGESPEKLKELAKALQVGYAYGTTDQTGFGAVRHESLDSTLKWIEASEESPALWKAIKKGKATSAVEEFAILKELGGASSYPEGGLPEEYNEDLGRDFEQVKLVGSVGQVSYFAKSNNLLKEAEALQIRLKTIAMLKYADILLVNGNADMIPTEWNGIYPQFLKRVKYESQNVIDLEGKTLRPEVFNQAGLIVQDNYGNPSNLQGWFGQAAYKDYTDHLIKTRQWFVGSPIGELSVSPEKFKLANAKGSLNTDIFMKHKGETYTGAPHPKLNSTKTAFAKTNQNAPESLNSSTCTVSITGSGHKIPAGVYDYAIVPVNRYGCGAAFEITSQTITSSKEKAVFTISDNGSAPGFEATKFDLYRKLTSATGKDQYRYVTSFKAVSTKEDTGAFIPGTTRGFICEWNSDQVWRFDQLLPLMKMPLATISDSMRFLLKLYGTPKVFNANKMVWIENIGSTAWT